jgi:hypothetical protein
MEEELQPLPQFFQPELLYWSCEKNKESEACWCGGNLESMQTLHLHLGFAFTGQVTWGLSEPPFL